jgi:subtilisin family serine protease
LSVPASARCLAAREPRRVCQALLACAVCAQCSLSQDARAQVPMRDLQELFASGHAARVAGGGWFSTLPSASRGARVGAGQVHWIPVGTQHAVMRSRAGSLLDWALDEPGLTWTPPRHLLLDRARSAIKLDSGAARAAGSGQGVVIGIVDAGVDISHPDLRNADGTTRVAWWIDFSSDPAGAHPDLEQAFGCEPDVGLRCQILDAADLDQRLQNGVLGDEPRDALGHGTHVASIAAGNGLAANDAGFVGIAPEATLIVARVTGAVGTISDSDVVLATQFVFDRSAELGMPAVVNLSLGGDFGAHDGSSELSQVLASFVSNDQPGRAIVVAAGNSGEVHTGGAGEFAEPLGIHAEVAVPRGGALRMPLLTPPPRQGGPLTDASLFVWLNLYPADALRVGVQLPDGTLIYPIAAGQVETRSAGELVAAVIHGLGEPAQAARVAAALPGVSVEGVLPSAGAAVILIDGKWAAGGTFSILIEGEGRVEAWVQSEGDLAPEAGSAGAAFAGATSAQTITIPAAHPALIAVGASVNRVDWTDATGARVSVAGLDAEPALAVGAAAFFSSAGPNALGDTKPDLLAPGGFVIAAMAAAADPRQGAFGVFSGGLCSSFACQVVSDRYAVTAGTSMAAPMVSGAAALLLAQNPRLTQNELRGLLQAGSAVVLPGSEATGRDGGGVLDVAGSFDASTTSRRDVSELPDAGHSRLQLAGPVALRDPTRSLSALLWLRDAAGAVFDARLERLGVEIQDGLLVQSLERVAPGLYRLRVRAEPTTAEDSLRIQVLIDDQPFLSAQLPIDAAGRKGRAAGLSSGCSVIAGYPGDHAVGVGAATNVLGLALLCCWRRRPLRARPGTP